MNIIVSGTCGTRLGAIMISYFSLVRKKVYDKIWAIFYDERKKDFICRRLV
jgi:hypothetical protein